ncbi:hypothetical protein RND71_008559 [Anisodus tanguticus]|uniref:Uncharacterized protein n=1 Tax=Anisodus tanguticus TaxID=243964 RepID=A0AAE1SNY8_9SOLA|nr:hypothetical protein RND71_008559 [Anisodus tanguticus]
MEMVTSTCVHERRIKWGLNKRRSENLAASLQEALIQKEMILQKCEEILSKVTRSDQFRSTRYNSKVKWLADEMNALNETSLQLQRVTDSLSLFEFPSPYNQMDLMRRRFFAMVNYDYNVINLFVVDDCELAIDVPNIRNYVVPSEPNVAAAEPNVETAEPSLGVATDCSSTEDEDKNDSGSSAYESDELYFFANQRRMNINDKLLDYKELGRCMTFKDIPEARKCLKLYSLDNKNELQELPEVMKVVLPKANHRPKVKWNRAKDEAIKRQGAWSASRRDSVMVCSICGESNHNEKACKKGKKQQKRKKAIVDYEDIDVNTLVNTQHI